MARPRTTLASLPKDWKDICKLVGEDGGSAVELRAALGIGRSAWETLLTDSTEFQAAVKSAEDASNVWWEKLGRTLAKNGGGNSAVWIFNMKNRFGWRDKQDDAAEEGEGAAPVRVVVEVKDGRKDADSH